MSILLKKSQEFEISKNGIMALISGFSREFVFCWSLVGFI